MSIDDDYFDVKAAVEGTPDEAAFERIATYMAEIETEIDRCLDKLKQMAALRAAFKEFMKDNPEKKDVE